jgi:hypothetical protein
MNRNIALSVVALAVLSLLALNLSRAATTASTAPARHYYLTKATVNGNETLKACASGYHFASFAELVDPAVLTYNKSLGRSHADDGAGPPSDAFGWVRTGYASNSTVDGSTPTNCNLWTSGAGTDNGEVGVFYPDAGGNNTEPAFVFASNGACDNSQGDDFGVWCVEN